MLEELGLEFEENEYAGTVSKYVNKAIIIIVFKVIGDRLGIFWFWIRLLLIDII